MRTVSYSSLEKKFQYVAGASALDNWEKNFFLNTLNRRLKDAWEYARWPELVELQEADVGPVYTATRVGQELADQYCPTEHAPTTWYDASDESTVTLNGDKVTEFRDKVGPLHLSNSVVSDQPQYLTGDCGLNGLNAIRFDGFDDNLIHTGAGPFNGGEMHTFVVYQLHDLRYGSIYLQPSRLADDGVAPDNTNDNFVVAHAPWNAGQIAYQYGQGDSIGLTDKDVFKKGETLVMQIGSSHRDGYGFARINSVELDRVDVAYEITDQYVTNFQVGGRQHSDPNKDRYDDFHLGMYLGEMMIFNTYLSPEHQAIIEAHLARKWGVGPTKQIASKGTPYISQDVLEVYSNNPYEGNRAYPVKFNLLDSRVILDKDYNNSKVWMLCRKPFTEVTNTGSVPAIFESYLVSAILADFYRADGQQNKAMYEDQQADEALLKQLDKFERQGLQSQIPVVTYQSPNTQRYVQI